MDRVAELFAQKSFRRALALVFFARGRPVLVGTGLGLLLQASALLVFDTFAEARAEVYLAWLRSGA